MLQRGALARCDRPESDRWIGDRRCSLRSPTCARLWRSGRTITTLLGRTRARQPTASRLCQNQRSRNATGRGAALRRGLRAPSGCTTEPTGLKAQMKPGLYSSADETRGSGQPRCNRAYKLSSQFYSYTVAIYQAGKIIPIPTLHQGMRQFQ